MPRKAIYTEEEAKKRRAEQNARAQKKNSVLINIRFTHADKEMLEAYAKYKGLPIGTMIRQAVQKCMGLDGWSYEEEAQETKDNGE